MNDGEADLLRAVERRLHARFAHLHVARDVLEHHDRVVDHETHAQRQRHQRQVVQAVAEDVHERESADDRQRQREARDEGRGDAAEEHKDDQHDEHEREQQRELDVAHRFADRLRAIVERGELDRRRQLCLKGR